MHCSELLRSDTVWSTLVFRVCSESPQLVEHLTGMEKSGVPRKYRRVDRLERGLPRLSPIGEEITLAEDYSWRAKIWRQLRRNFLLRLLVYLSLLVFAVITVSEYVYWIPAFVLALLAIVAVFLFVSGIDFLNMARKIGRSIGSYDEEMQEYAKARGWHKWAVLLDDLNFNDYPPELVERTGEDPTHESITRTGSLSIVGKDGGFTAKGKQVQGTNVELMQNLLANLLKPPLKLVVVASLMEMEYDELSKEIRETFLAPIDDQKTRIRQSREAVGTWLWLVDRISAYMNNSWDYCFVLDSEDQIRKYVPMENHDWDLYYFTGDVPSIKKSLLWDARNAYRHSFAVVVGHGDQGYWLEVSVLSDQLTEADQKMLVKVVLDDPEINRLTADECREIRQRCLNID